MGRRDQRMKASDVFRESNPVFSRKVSFEEAFPEIADIVIEISEDGKDVPYLEQGEKEYTYRIRDYPGEFVDCSNSLCYNGGISIGSLVHKMYREHATELQISKLCRGYEGSPKGRRKYGRCLNFFRVEISITYRNHMLEPGSN